MKKEEVIWERKSIIVGIDFGIIVGIVVIDFDGRIVVFYSERNMFVGEVFCFISEIGYLVIIVMDVFLVLGFVEKIVCFFKV